MVLDGNVDPRDVWYQANLNQDIAFERNIKIWFGWIAKYDDVYHLGTTGAAVEELYYAQPAAAATKHPAGGVVGPDEWNDMFLVAGLLPVDGWAGPRAGVRRLGERPATSTRLVGAYGDADGPGDDNGFAVYNAVQCTDVQWPQAWSTWAEDNWATYKMAPFLTWGNAWFNAPCLYWPAPAGTPVTVDGGGTARAAHRRDPRRGHAVRGQPRGP